MAKLDYIKEVLKQDNFNADELLKTDKEYVVLCYTICNAFWKCEVTYTDDFTDPSEDDCWNGYDCVLETYELINIYNDMIEKGEL